MESFKDISDGIKTAIRNSQEQFLTTTGKINAALAQERETIANTVPRATLSVSNAELNGNFLSQPFFFNIYYRNVGNDTAFNVRHLAAVYVTRRDNKDDQIASLMAFEKDWKQNKEHSPASVSSSAEPFFSLKPHPLSAGDVESMKKNISTLTYIVRLGWKDRTGSWLTDRCDSYQNPNESLTIAHPCMVANVQRYPARDNRSLFRL